MNELLEDFAAKAQLEAEWVTPQGLEWFGAFKQKFAELIVRECIQVASNAKSLEAAAMIKQHFGVEE